LPSSRVSITIAQYLGKRDVEPERARDEGLSPVVTAPETAVQPALTPLAADDRPVRLGPVRGRGGRAGSGRPARSSLWLGGAVLVVLALAVAPYELLLPKVPVRGIVRDRVSAEPIAGARVRLGQTATTTDGGGAFAAERASLAEPLQAQADGYQALETRIWPAGEQRVELVPRRFALSVRDAETGEPIPDAVLAAPGVRFRAVEPGRFQVEPAHDSLTLTVSADGFRSAVVRYRDDREVVVPLQPRLLGIVVDRATGRPVPGAFLASGNLAATADANGVFELERRPAGPLRVLAAGYRRAEVDASEGRELVATLESMTVRALYLTYFGVGDRSLRQNVLTLAERTEVNAVVIDVKGDRGRLTYRSDVPLAEVIGANAEPTVSNVDELLATLKERGIYTIARIVVFKDDVLARNGLRAGLDVAIKERLSEQPWTDGEGLAWVDPLRPEVWQYNVDLAREAALKGFDEIQFDYARFPLDAAGGLSTQARYSRPWITERDRVDAIGGFLKLARDEVRLAGALVAADVFGYVTWNDGDSGVGHNIETLAGVVDYLCPTIYPSSFRAGLPGVLNFPQVLQQPYAVVFESVRRARARTGDQGAALRPWLQYFDDFAWQTGRPFRTAEIDAQRNGAVAAGAAGWMMWDPSNRYLRGGLGSRP
jgi:hypothetical protein